MMQKSEDNERNLWIATFGNTLFFLLTFTNSQKLLQCRMDAGEHEHEANAVSTIGIKNNKNGL